MSIIYDALQKTQRNRESKREATEKDRGRRFSISIDVSLIVIITVLVAMLVMAYFPRLKSHAAPKAVPIVAPEPPVVAKPNMVLNGVFLSDSEKLAMINNQTFRLGDTVEGMKIIAIELNKVKLQKADQVFDLEVIG